MIRQLAGPDPQGVTRLAAETGIPQSTLARWLREAGKPVSKLRKSVRRPQDITALERARLVVDASALCGEARGAFLRENGVREAQLQAWTQALQASSAAVSSSNVKADAKRIKQLEKELARKDRALAETAALLVLKKKAALYFGAEEGDDILNQSER